MLNELSRAICPCCPFPQAMECRRKEDAEACVQKGLSVAVTDSARAKLVGGARASEGAGVGCRSRHIAGVVQQSAPAGRA